MHCPLYQQLVKNDDTDSDLRYEEMKRNKLQKRIHDPKMSEKTPNVQTMRYYMGTKPKRQTKRAGSISCSVTTSPWNRQNNLSSPYNRYSRTLSTNGFMKSKTVEADDDSKDSIMSTKQSESLQSSMIYSVGFPLSNIVNPSNRAKSAANNPNNNDIAPLRFNGNGNDLDKCRPASAEVESMSGKLSRHKQFKMRSSRRSITPELVNPLPNDTENNNDEKRSHSEDGSPEPSMHLQSILSQERLTDADISKVKKLSIGNLLPKDLSRLRVNTCTTDEASAEDKDEGFSMINDSDNDENVPINPFSTSVADNAIYSDVDDENIDVFVDSKSIPLPSDSIPKGLQYISLL